MERTATTRALALTAPIRARRLCGAQEQTHGKSNDTTIFLMKNGCMCCSGDSPGLELERVLDKLISLLEFAQASGSAKAFDHVIIETTGLADPAPIVSLLFRYSTQRAAHFALNGVVTLVDAKVTSAGSRRSKHLVSLCLRRAVVPAHRISSAT